VEERLSGPLGQRDRQPELMDDPTLDAAAHHAALGGLRRVNRISRSQRLLWQVLSRMAHDRRRPLRVLDVATGGGDVVVQLARLAQRRGLPIEFHACDLSQRALEFARQHATSRGVDTIRFFTLDALTSSLPDDFDVMMSTLFLHHLSTEQAALLLERMARATRKAVLIDDLRRTRLGYLLAQAGCRLLTRSHVVHTDGPLSVRAAFTDTEVLQLAERAGLAGARLTRHWPQRFLLEWSR
jgi:2-polyprenyl-3-methyl-5-hydroxy-6-metoxy-1,4-benzoquinol methylase